MKIIAYVIIVRLNTPKIKLCPSPSSVNVIGPHETSLRLNIVEILLYSNSLLLWISVKFLYLQYAKKRNAGVLCKSVCLSRLRFQKWYVISPCSFHQHKELQLGSCTNCIISEENVQCEREH